MPKKRDNVVPVRFNDAEVAVLDRLSASKGLTRSAVLRTAFLEHPATVLEMAKTVKSSGHIKGR